MQTTLIALLAGFSGLALVQAAEMPSRGPMPFGVFDSDADGTITEQEFLQTHERRQALREAQGRRTRVVPDVRMFHAFDSNGDGLLNRDELAAGQLANQQGRVGMKHPGLPPGEGRGTGMGRNMPRFSDFDADKDGQLTEEEFNEGRAKRISERAQQGYMMRGLQYAKPFTELDADSNGLVNSDEFAAAQARHRQQRMAR